MKKETFAAQVAENEKAQKHAQEIQQSRVGGLGGSDAAILMKIGCNGMSSLTATDQKRLAVMQGLIEPDQWSGNAYTHAGHEFEDYAELVLPLGDSFKREKVIEKKLANNFKTFAHADFAVANGVIECKFVQDETPKVAEKYRAQLQWYYVLGAKEVQLYHGRGTAEPFEVEEATLVSIERDEVAINWLLHGIKILDDAIADGWTAQVQDKIDVENTPAVVQKAFAELEKIKAEEDDLKKRKADAVDVLKTYIEDFGLTGIFSTGENKHSATYVKETMTRTFDVQGFLKKNPAFDIDQNYKTSKRAASLTFK